MKNPDDPDFWIIDEEAAVNVRRIDRMTLAGVGTDQIAQTFEKEKILTPSHYWASKGERRPGFRPESNPYRWNSSTICTILENQKYCGDVINFTTYSKSYKLKKRLKNSEENIKVFLDVHEPIRERAVHEKIQAMRQKKTCKRKPYDGEKSMFAGLLQCADCGSRLGAHFNQKNPSIKYFNCINNNTNRDKTCDKTHYVRVDFLEEVVLKEIRRLTKFASQYENYFVKTLIGQGTKTLEFERKRKEKELAKLVARDKELDTLFNRLYEDNVSGKIDDERFSKMTKGYTSEQVEIAKKVKELQAELEKEGNKSMTADFFIKAVRKYTHAKKLNARMLNELIDHIEVYHAEKIDGVKTQKLNIHYNCVGVIEIPDLSRIPDTDVTIKTRKGVEVSYAPTPKIDEQLQEAM